MPELDSATSAVATDKLEASNPSESAANAPQAPPPAPAAVEEYAPVPAESKELGTLKVDAVREDDADAARQRSLGYAGDFGDTEAKLKAKDATAPTATRDERVLSRVAAKPQSAVVTGASSGALAPVCTRGTFDASDEGRWSVTDLPRGLDDLRTVLGAVGGRLESFEPQTTRHATVVIPRARYAEWIRAAKIQGVAGLADAFPDGDGDCVRQKIRIVPPQRP